MKIKLELFGASRDFSNKDHLELNKCKDLKDVTREVTKKMKYYNEKRPQLGLKKMPPTEYRRHLNF